MAPAVVFSEKRHRTGGYFFAFSDELTTNIVQNNTQIPSGVHKVRIQCENTWIFEFV